MFHRKGISPAQIKFCWSMDCNIFISVLQVSNSVLINIEKVVYQIELYRKAIFHHVLAMFLMVHWMCNKNVFSSLILAIR